MASPFEIGVVGISGMLGWLIFNASEVSSSSNQG